MTWQMVITRVRNIAEHAVVPDNNDVFRNARTTYASWWVARVRRALLGQLSRRSSSDVLLCLATQPAPPALGCCSPRASASAWRSARGIARCWRRRCRNRSSSRSGLMQPQSFILAQHRARSPPPLVPEIRLHLATEVVPLWRKTEENSKPKACRRLIGLSPGPADRRWRATCSIIRRRWRPRACSISAPAPASSPSRRRRPAQHACSPPTSNAFAAAGSIALLNAQGANDTDDRRHQRRRHRARGRLVHDPHRRMCYERPLAERLLEWLRAQDALVLLGDPGRSYFPNPASRSSRPITSGPTRELEDRVNTARPACIALA